MSGFSVVQLPSDSRGNVDMEALKAECDDTVVGLMLTNPNTLGLFEEHVLKVCEARARLRRFNVRRWRQSECFAGHRTPR